MSELWICSECGKASPQCEWSVMIFNGTVYRADCPNCPKPERVEVSK